MGPFGRPIMSAPSRPGSAAAARMLRALSNGLTRLRRGNQARPRRHMSDQRVQPHPVVALEPVHPDSSRFRAPICTRYGVSATAARWLKLRVGNYPCIGRCFLCAPLSIIRRAVQRCCVALAQRFQIGIFSRPLQPLRAWARRYGALLSGLFKV